MLKVTEIKVRFVMKGLLTSTDKPINVFIYIFKYLSITFFTNFNDGINWTTCHSFRKYLPIAHIYMFPFRKYLPIAHIYMFPFGSGTYGKLHLNIYLHT